MENTNTTNNSETNTELEIEKNFYAELDNLQVIATENIITKYLNSGL